MLNSRAGIESPDSGCGKVLRIKRTYIIEPGTIDPVPQPLQGDPLSSADAVLISSASNDQLAIVPGSAVVVRDEEWLVTNVEQAPDGWLIDVIGTSGITRDQEARFSTGLDRAEANTKVVADRSPRFTSSRLSFVARRCQWVCRIWSLPTPLSLTHSRTNGPL